MYLILCYILLLLIALTLWLRHLNKDYYVLALCKRIKTTDDRPLAEKVFVLPGTTIFGNNFDVIGMSPAMLFRFSRNCNRLSGGRSYVYHFLNAAFYNVTTAEDSEQVFQSTSLITKNIFYDLVKPFLGEGLLTSTGAQWHFRRKTLTPAFHFNVLQTFLEIFKEESSKTIKQLSCKTLEEIELKKLIPQFTLNSVCETALGVKLDDMEGSERYRESIRNIEGVILQRVSNIHQFFPIIFYIFGDYRKQVDNLKIAHSFSSAIIERKRDEFRMDHDAQMDEFGRRKRYAMLDTLLAVEAAGQIDHVGICDEVNTFMFEGYDTTAMCLVFALLNLALHIDVQERCYREVCALANYAELGVFDYNKLQYLECVIKETLRLYPSVPFVGRMCLTECVVNGLNLPANTQINVHIYDIMRDPRHFPEPEAFQPERFLPENSVGRHPFAFVPFSAGQRNCIGQKFAMLEVKVLLVALLQNFRILPVTRLEDIIIENGLIIRTQKPIKVKFIKR